MTDRQRTDDQQIVDRAARRVAWTLGVTASVVVALGVVGFALAVTVGSRHELDEYERKGTPPDAITWVIDRDKVIMLIVAFGIAAIAVVGLMGWITAKRAVVPLTESLDRQRRFVADASHELRTPLTVLSTRVQLLQHRLSTGQPVTDTVTALDQDAQSLASTLDDLLMVTGRPSESMPVVDMRSAVQTAADAMVIVGQSRHVRLNLQLETAGFVRMPRKSLERCATALIDNALAHSPEHGTVTVQTRQHAKRAVLTVQDEGSGIAGVDAAHVFDRFVHASAQSTAAPGRAAHQGFGIGLALVRELAERCGGDVAVARTDSTGTVMRLSLPVHDERRIA